MKRFFTILFILFFCNHALAETKWITKKKKKEPSQTIKTYDWIAVIKHPQSDIEFIATKVSTEKSAKNIALKKCYEFVTKQLDKKGYDDCYVNFTLNEKENPQLAKEIIYKQTKNLIAKKQPSQTQEVAGNIIKPKVSFCLKKAVFFYMDPVFYSNEGCYGHLVITQQEYIDRILNHRLSEQNLSAKSWFSKRDVKKQIAKNIIKEFDELGLDTKYLRKTLENVHRLNKNVLSQTQIAKAEPSQTQEVASSSYGDPLCVLNANVNFVKNDSTFCKGGMKQIFVKKHGMYDYFYSKLDKTQIAKKKTKVIKVEEPKQEEFKPETGDIDNDAPVIEIAEAITVNNPDYEIEGKVTDKADKIFVEVDGKPSEVKDGKFKIKRYSPVDHQIKIVAIDQWGNRSKEKIVNIKINLKDTDVAELEPLNPLKIKAKSSNITVALIIGVETYENAPAAKYASLDAKYFTEYAKNVFGVNKNNIKLLTDEEANLSKTNSAIFKWLPSKIKKNKTDLIVFYSGHGLASSNGKAKYILPSNADPDLLSRTAVSRSEFFDQIVSLKPKSVTIFFDTCYSGVSRDEEMLLASAKPLMIVADEVNKLPENFTIFSASQLDQISSGLKEAKHGIFSYYLMKGLEGKADSNKDKKITNGELLAYMDENVSEKALDLGRQQNPSLAGDPNKVLMSYR